MSVRVETAATGAPWSRGGDALTPGTADRPQTLVEESEQIARTAPETVRLEFISGKPEVKQVPDGDHGAITMWLLEQRTRQRPGLALYPERGVEVDGYRGGRARPDGALVPEDHFAGQGEWAEPDGVPATVEVTSYAPDADRRGRVGKRDAHAAADVPAYLLAGRDDHSVTVHSEPEGGTYRSRTTRPYGAGTGRDHAGDGAAQGLRPLRTCPGRAGRSGGGRRSAVRPAGKNPGENAGGAVDPAVSRSTYG